MSRFFPIAGLAVVILVNFLANYLPIGGMTTGEMSDAYPTLFTPAGFTFSIWGLIYLSLIGYVNYQALPSVRRTFNFERINRFFLINCAGNALWIFAWHHHLIGVSMGLMLVILGTLIFIYREIRKQAPSGLAASVFLKLPFSLYVGWISVATLANISVLQVATGTESWWLQEFEWTLIKIAAAGAVGSVMLVRFRDGVFAAVVAWAAFGIYAANQGSTPVIAGAAITTTILLMVVWVIERVNPLFKG